MRNLNVHWLCDPAILSHTPQLTPSELAEMLDCEKIIQICRARGYPLSGDFSARMRQIRRAAILRAHPRAYLPSGEIAEGVERFVPSIEWVGGAEQAKIKVESGLPSEVESRLEPFLELFRSLYVRWNDRGDAVLFAYYGPPRGAQHVPLVQWSVGHDPPDLSQLAYTKPSKQRPFLASLAAKWFRHLALLRCAVQPASLE